MGETSSFLTNMPVGTGSPRFLRSPFTSCSRNVIFPLFFSTKSIAVFSRVSADVETEILMRCLSHKVYHSGMQYALGRKTHPEIPQVRRSLMSSLFFSIRFEEELLLLSAPFIFVHHCVCLSQQLVNSRIAFRSATGNPNA